MAFINTDDDLQKDNSSSTDNNTTELDFNKQKREDYEGLMKESSTQLDGYWDSRNPMVKIVLLVLAVIIIVGSAYYIMTYLGSQ